MVRRTLFPVFLVALGLAGAASATLATGRSPALTTASSSTAPACGSTTTATTGLKTTMPTVTAAVGSATSGSATTGSATTASTAIVTTTTGLTTTAGPTTVLQRTSPTTTGCTTTTKPATTALTTTAAELPVLMTSSATSTLVITGHGWGHGIGMSQWGADGYALHGWGYARILLHYYRGTTIAKRPSLTVRVLLADGRRRVTLNSDSPWQLVDGLGTKLELPAGKLVVPASLVVSGQTLVSPLTFAPGTTPVELGRQSYRGGLLVVSNGKVLQVVNALGLESYVQGVVGSEVPSSWPPAALEAQAVAARSYALAELENVVTARPFDVYGDTRSQAYGGIATESPQVTKAVEATAHQILLYRGKVATTYFSSSSGGRTVSAAEATGTPVPYLVSVPDPYDTVSPYHDWGPVLVDARKAGKALGLPGQLVDLQITPGPSGHNTTVIAVGATAQLTLTGAAIREDLGLRSTWFRVGWLTLAPPRAPVTFGGAASLDGFARGLSGVSLEAKTQTAGWQPVTAVTPDSTGAFSIVVRPQATTQYRLATGNVRAALINVRVGPRVSATLNGGVVQGTVRPAASGAVVQVQRQDGAPWTTVATGTTDSTGAFLIQAQLAPGTYRVRCAPGHGLSPGVSPPLIVVS